MRIGWMNFLFELTEIACNQCELSAGDHSGFWSNGVNGNRRRNVNGGGPLPDGGPTRRSVRGPQESRFPN